MIRNKEIRHIFIEPSTSIISGVCAALANYFKVDATVIRLLFIVLIFVNLTSLFCYIFLAAVLPRVLDNSSEPTMHGFDKLEKKDRIQIESSDKIKLIAFLITGIGAYLFLNLLKFPLIIRIWDIPILYILAITLLTLGLMSIFYIQYLQTKKKSLQISLDDKMISGVIGGIAKTLEIDPNLLRTGLILFSVLFIKSILITLILYVILALFLEKEELNLL